MDYSKFLDICDRKKIFVQDEDLDYACWKDSPLELRKLWENDTRVLSPITKKEIDLWNNLPDKHKRVLIKHQRFEYIDCYIDNFFDIPVDIINLHASPDAIEEYGYMIDEIIREIITKYGLMLDGGKIYYDIDCKSFPDLHSLIFYMHPNRGEDFPIPSYDRIPVENIARWKELIEDPSETQVITWLEKNIHNNDLDDFRPMNRMYG